MSGLVSMMNLPFTVLTPDTFGILFYSICILFKLEMYFTQESEIHIFQISAIHLTSSTLTYIYIFVMAKC